MTVDEQTLKRIKDRFAERFEYLRQKSGKSIAGLADALKVNRKSVYNIQNGDQNFSIDLYVRLIEACGQRFDVFLDGFRKEDAVPAAQQRHFEDLEAILSSDYEHLRTGATVVLDTIRKEAFNLKAALAEERKTRDGPERQENREEGGNGEWTRQAEEPQTVKAPKTRKRQKRAAS